MHGVPRGPRGSQRVDGTRNRCAVPGLVPGVRTLLLLSLISAHLQTPLLAGRDQRSPHVGSEHAVPVSIEFAADSASVFSIRTDGIVRRWSLETGDLLSSFGSTELRFRSAAVSPDGGGLASGDEEGVLRIWKADAFAPMQTLHAHRSSISRIVWSPDSRRIATFGYQRDMALWDATTGESIARFSSLDENGTCACATFTPDSRKLVFSVGEESIRVCDAASGDLLRTLTGNEGGVSGLCLSPNGSLLAVTTSGGDKDCGRCRVWDLAAGRQVTVLGRESPGGDGQFDAIVLARFSEDGSELMTMDAFGLVEVRCGAWLELRTSFQVPGSAGWPPTCDGDYHPGTDLLIPALQDPCVHVFRARDAEEVGLLSCDAPAAVRIQPWGRFILTVSGKVLRAFDARTLELRLTRIEYEEGNWLCLTPDLHFSGTPGAETWARVSSHGKDWPPTEHLDPAFRSSAAIRKALSGE
jgi:hypothetical protein